MQEALAMVRRELGPDAAVLHTRSVGRGLFRWLGARKGFEVIASREVRVPSRLAAREQRGGRGDEPGGGRLPSRDPRVDVQDELKSQISQLQAMVERLCQSADHPRSASLPPALFPLYTDLIEAEVGEHFARQLVERLRRRDGAHDLTSPAQARRHLVELLAGEICSTGPIVVEPGSRQVAALVGPTGVGKTTTIAKLAANFRLREKRRVGLITVDTYRVAAVEQLRTYAEIIELPMEVVSTPREMRGAIQRLADQDLTLIDTAGRSPADEVKIQELKALLQEARPTQVHLVLTSAASATTLKRTVELFQPAAPTACIFTKLDEALALGNLLEVLLESRLPVSYLTDGQNVPDDIEAADSQRLVRRILGMDVLS